MSPDELNFGRKVIFWTSVLGNYVKFTDLSSSRPDSRGSKEAQGCPERSMRRLGAVGLFLMSYLPSVALPIRYLVGD